MQDMDSMSRLNIWKNYGRMYDNLWRMCKEYGKCIDERKVEVKIKDGKRMMNGRWKHGRFVRKSGMDGACPQCRVQVEEEK